MFYLLCIHLEIKFKIFTSITLLINRLNVDKLIVMMKFPKYIFIVMLFSHLFANSFGYLRLVEFSFCMDDCSQYMIEDETGNFIAFLANTNDIDLTQYIDRYVEVESGGNFQCIECSAIIIDSIYLSDACEYPVQCFADPCVVALPCELNTAVNCESNYCDGCYADFYDLDGNLVDCYNMPIDECTDLSGISFGMCDMWMGIALIDGQCQGISGCGWEVDGVDYSEAFFASFEDCQLACSEDLSCSEIEIEYSSLHSGEYVSCNQDSDCTAIWGDCGVGLGECHYSVNDTFNYNQSDELVQDWVDADCMDWVCDCLPLPNSVCVEEECNLTYCETPNPVGCWSSGCEDGYECVDLGNTGYAEFCTPSSCFCDENYSSSWVCTEDCNGGICIPEEPQSGDICIYDYNLPGLHWPGFIDCYGECLPYEYNEWVGDGWCDDGWGYSFNCEALNFDDGDCENSCNSGDVNSDATLNILDVVLMVECILNSEDLCTCADINQDGQINVMDIIMVINLIIS